jgi:hypothetical protein
MRMLRHLAWRLPMASRRPSFPRLGLGWLRTLADSADGEVGSPKLQDGELQDFMLSDEELAQALESKGVPVPLGADRPSLEELLRSTSAVIKEEVKGAYPRIMVRSSRKVAEPCEANVSASATCPSTTQLLKVGPLFGSATVSGPSGQVNAVATLDLRPRPDSWIQISVREPSEASAYFPPTFKRKDSMPSDAELWMSQATKDAVRAALEPGYPFRVSVDSTLALAGTHSSLCPHVLATFAALRHAGVLVRPVGAARVGLLDGDLVVEPTTVQTHKAQCVATVVVLCDTGDLVSLNVEGRFVSQAQVELVAAKAHEVAMQTGVMLLNCVPEVTSTPAFWHATLGSDAVAVPPDFVPALPADNLVDSVRRVAGPILEQLAKSPYQGMEVVHAVLQRVERLCAETVRVRSTYGEVRAALQLVLADCVQSAARPEGMPWPSLHWFEGAKSSKYVEVSHGALGSAAVYLDLATSDPRGDFRSISSVWGEPRLTCHVTEYFNNVHGHGLHALRPFSLGVR